MCERSTTPGKTTGGTGRAAEGAITDRVRKFYEQFHFPGVRPLDQDGLILMRHLAACLPGPGRKGPHKRVLDAGCGTGNTGISLARRFEDVEFLGIDFSAPSLSVAVKATQEAGLHNIRFRQWNLLERELHEGLFDIVLCLGVLHHTANMAVVLANLREAMTDEGALYLWVYGQHGRYRHSLNRRVLDMLLSADPPEDPVGLAREFLLNGGNGAVSHDLFGTGLPASLKEKVGNQPAWIADQFLSPNEILLTMESLLPLLRNAGLELAQWLGLPERAPRLLGSAPLLERFDQLGRDQQMIALDLLLKPDRYFLVLRKVSNPEVASS
jgi:SAM-dependent methyltransferase